MWNRSQQKLLRLADEEGSSLSTCADVPRSSLSILINLSSFESCTRFFSIWHFGSEKCVLPLCSVMFSSVVLLLTFAFPVFLQITCICMKYSVSCYSISVTPVCSGRGSCMAYLSVTQLCIPGHGLVLTYQMSVFILCLKGLPEHSASPPLPAKQLTQLCKLTRLPEPLNRFILVFVHPGTCQYGGGKKNRLWMCWILSM